MTLRLWIGSKTQALGEADVAGRVGERPASSVAVSRFADDSARAHGVVASARPAWVDALTGLAMGIMAALLMTRSPWGIAVALVLPVLAALLTWRASRSRRQITDDKAMIRHMRAFVPTYSLVGVVSLLIGPASPQWVHVSFCIAIVVGIFVQLRIAEHHQTRRLLASN